MEGIIQKAMEMFEIPAHRTHYLFLLPAFYVAKADGKLSMKEIMALRLHAVTLGLIGPQDEDSAELETFFEKKIEQFGKELKLSDLDLLAKAINARLTNYTPDKAKAIRESIYQLCMHVADASGPLFGENITEEEREMLKQIFYKLEK
ncbi:MAG: TerB family tellurite resistance protein [candidate division KSB1 bacterium]|nr:TerB family tellurite resistance protein [candidate division KSB1 bacterium]MDZ7336354.1 TerB family tellurite resistance protein [candidate division KSB1 bacterium]MDZ7356666.1 TerB family tellurite resistance protein [candidate division KSB1 bacterium]MDZ7377292.1 TerB family tellurite resistance protein [candidate division KSB1 bacterium]MDZ7398543.1 TerB family tellurite resistance protein [candidate division KSB1 bacterium]